MDIGQNHDLGFRRKLLEQILLEGTYNQRDVRLPDQRELRFPGAPRHGASTPLQGG